MYSSMSISPLPSTSRAAKRRRSSTSEREPPPFSRRRTSVQNSSNSSLPLESASTAWKARAYDARCMVPLQHLPPGVKDTPRGLPTMRLAESCFRVKETPRESEDWLCGNGRSGVLGEDGRGAEGRGEEGRGEEGRGDCDRIFAAAKIFDGMNGMTNGEGSCSGAGGGGI